MISSLEKVTREEVQLVAQEFFGPGAIAASVVGKLHDFDLTEKDLVCTIGNKISITKSKERRHPRHFISGHSAH